MLGAIVGDIVGSRFEFDNTDRYDFELFTPECDFTDDTICTIGVADAIMHGGDYMGAVHEWCRRYPNPTGAYGGNFRRWVMSRNPRPYGSYGNGSAMRVAPVAWAFDTPEEVAHEAELTARISHDHPEGIKGAVVTALVIYHLRRGEERLCRQLVCHNYGADYAQRLPERGFFDVTCQGCVPLCWHMMETCTDFEDTLRRTVSYGGDTDTTGAIVGSMAEARYGVPADMAARARSYLPAEMLRVADDFAEFCRVRKNG